MTRRFCERGIENRIFNDDLGHDKSFLAIRNQPGAVNAPCRPRSGVMFARQKFGEEIVGRGLVTGDGDLRNHFARGCPI